MDYGLCYPSGPAHYSKTPDESLTLTFPWASRLEGDTIASTTYELPDGLTNAAEASPLASVRTIRVTGGDDGGLYRVVCKVTKTGGGVLEWVKRVRVLEG